MMEKDSLEKAYVGGKFVVDIGLDKLDKTFAVRLSAKRNGKHIVYKSSGSDTSNMSESSRDSFEEELNYEEGDSE